MARLEYWNSKPDDFFSINARKRQQDLIEMETKKLNRKLASLT